MFSITSIFLLLASIASFTNGVLLTESEFIGMDSSKSLLPQQELSDKIKGQLVQIRKTFPVVSGVTYGGKWVPGELMARKVSDEQITRVNASEYAYITEVKKYPDSMWVFMRFSKPYNPEQLAREFKIRFEIMEAEPNQIVGSQTGITYDPIESIYTFWRGEGDCTDSGCQDKKFWVFHYNEENDKVSLLREH